MGPRLDNRGWAVFATQRRRGAFGGSMGPRLDNRGWAHETQKGNMEIEGSMGPRLDNRGWAHVDGHLHFPIFGFNGSTVG